MCKNKPYKTHIFNAYLKAVYLWNVFVLFFSLKTSAYIIRSIFYLLLSLWIIRSFWGCVNWVWDVHIERHVLRFLKKEKEVGKKSKPVFILFSLLKPSCAKISMKKNRTFLLLYIIHWKKHEILLISLETDV